VAVEIIAPNRQQPISREDGTPETRTQRFFVDVASAIKQLTAIGDITDVSVSTTANNTAKINEILQAFRDIDL
jgi:hypothetical protein